ncbi:MAG: TonB-dependent receptor [Candidatus Marinimicrobia bacterium]|nr:TonB-dependent receptor [Candidatus Neomarinimicrobiota bacterium]
MRTVIRMIPIFLIGTMLIGGSVIGTVSDANGKPLAGANVAVEGTSLGTATTADGTYSIRNVDRGAITLKTTYIGYQSQSKDVVMGAGKLVVDFSLDVDALSGKSVSVIGSRFARTAEEQSVPVDVFTAEDIRRSGFSETAQIIQALAPSFSMPRTTIADGSDAVRPMTLRGLSSGQVLVLVNGKRRHTTALVHVNNSPSRGDTGVDMNAIPASAIARVEVLRDGAAAQYGSDAIAGVINIVLKDGDTPGTFTFTSGASNHTVEATPTGYDIYGNGRRYNSGIAEDTPYEWNPTTETGDFSYIDGFYTDPELDALGVPTGDFDTTYYHHPSQLVTSSKEYKKHDGEVFQLQYSKGFALKDGGTFMLAAEYRHRGRTNRVGFEGNPYYEPESDYWANDEAEQNRLNVGSDFYIDPQRMIWGDGQQDNLGAFYNAELPFGDKTFYSFGGYSYRNSDAGCYTRKPSQPNKTWLSANPTGYVPHITPTIVDMSNVIGLKGAYNNWAYDISTVFGRNDFHYKMLSTNASFGPEQLREYDIGGFWVEQVTNNLDLTTKVNDVDLAIGAEIRNESYRIYAGEVASYANGQYGTSVAGWDSFTIPADTNGVAYADTFVIGLNSADGSGGCQCFSGFKPSNADATRDADRSSFALYGDAEKDLFPGMRIGVAGRFEDYSDFGNNFSFKSSVRYEVQQGIILRGAFSTGFRAPALAQAYQSKVATNFLNTPAGQVAFEVGTFPVDHPVAQALGATTLKPELSKNISAGISTTYAGFKLNFDFYHIKIEDRIVLTGNFTTAGLDHDEFGNPTGYADDPGSLGAHVYDLLADNNIPGAEYGGGGRYFTNAVNTKTTGFDVAVEYLVDMGSNGDLTLNLAYNSTNTEIDGDINTPDELADYGATIFDELEERTMTTVTPESNLIFTTKYAKGNLGSSIRINKVGKFESRRSAGLWFSSKTIIDLEASYDLGSITMAVGSKNFTDEMPDKWSDANNAGAFVYPNFAPYGMNGRYDYMRMSYNF